MANCAKIGAKLGLGSKDGTWSLELGPSLAPFLEEKKKNQA
jgi:hypothetical protein